MVTLLEPGKQPRDAAASTEPRTSCVWLFETELAWRQQGMMGAWTPLNGGTRGAGSHQRVGSATVLVSVLAVASVVALAARLASPGSALLSVSGLEREDKLEHVLSEKVRC